MGQKRKKTACAVLSEVVPRAGVEPARMFSPRDFKSLVSTNFTTWAFCCRLLSDNGAHYKDFSLACKRFLQKSQQDKAFVRFWTQKRLFMGFMALLFVH